MISGSPKISESSLRYAVVRAVAVACQIVLLAAGSAQNSAFAVGFISHHANHKVSGRFLKNNGYLKNSARAKLSRHGKEKLALKTSAKYSLHNQKSRIAGGKLLVSRNKSESYVLSSLKSVNIAPGVVYSKTTSGLRINVLDIDTVQAPVLVKPIVAPVGTPRLQTVNNLALSNHALAAVNANYFKTSGIPLGTLVIDGDWIAGPLYERVALGISKTGYPRIDKVNLGGMLTTSNLEAPQIWVNNVNQQHRTGSRVIAYTRRWGSSVSLPYDGSLVAINAQGEVIACAHRQLNIPYGGVVLTDSKASLLSSLKVGDLTYLHWQTTPSVWSDVTQAVSGGPMLIKNGNFCIDLQAEKFRGNWASNTIKARTGCGITADNHLLLVTVEGTHTIFDLAHILKELGAVDGMNLDGGGSTTMVVHNATVNMENKTAQRRVAAALGVFPISAGQKSNADSPCRYVPRQSLLDLIGDGGKLPNLSSIDKQEDGLARGIVDSVLNAAPTITAQNHDSGQTIPIIAIDKAL